MIRQGVRMLPECCPDNSETLSGCYRKQCPDVTEICTQVKPDSSIEARLGTNNPITKSMDYFKENSVE